MVLFPKKIKISKSMGKLLREKRFKLTRNIAFDRVIRSCAKVPRAGQDGTWITPLMIDAYNELHAQGHAVSYEVWNGERLVGGLYGIDLGHVFCGESMFSLEDNASKFALIRLAKDLERKEYSLIDCQVYTPHLESLGAECIPRPEFLWILRHPDGG